MTYGTLNAVVPLVFFLVLTSMAMMLPWLTLAGLGKGNSQGNVETMDLVGDDAEKDSTAEQSTTTASSSTPEDCKVQLKDRITPQVNFVQ